MEPTTEIVDALLLGRKSLKIKKVGGRFTEALRHLFELWERGRIPASLDQTEKVNGHTHDLSEVLLALAHFAADLPNPLSELLSQ